MGGSSVVLLFELSGPSAILRGIAEIIIYAVNTVLHAWSRTHIGIEVLKGFKPTVADRNPAFAIKRIGDILGACATLSHETPDVVFAGFGHAVCAESFGGYLGSEFPLQTTATLAVAADQTGTGDDGSIATVADNFPTGISVTDIRWTFGAANNKPTTKPLACHVNGSNNAVCDRITGHHDLLGVVVTRAGTLPTSPAQLITYPYCTTQKHIQTVSGAWT